MRREIPDVSTSVNFSVLQKGIEVPLTDVIPAHKDLFSAVPGLSDTTVKGISVYPKYKEAEDRIHSLVPNGIDQKTVKKKLFENIQTAIQNKENLAGSARHDGNLKELEGTLSAVQMARQSASPQDLPAIEAYEKYLLGYAEPARNALASGQVSGFPWVSPSVSYPPGSIGAAKEIDTALEKGSAGKREKIRVGDRSVNPNTAKEPFYGYPHPGYTPMENRVILPTTLNSSDQAKLTNFIRNWYGVQK